MMSFSNTAKRRSASIAAILAAFFSVPAIADDSHEDLDLFEFEHVSCRGGDNEIRIVVEGVKKSAGLITADLYPNRQEGFLRGKGRLKQVKFAAKAPLTRFCITAPENGDFAVTIYHDRNANGDFDKTGLGMPAEPWGLSNNPKVRFGPPTVDKTIFPVAENGANVKIKLNN